MKCKNCGAELKDGVAFCKECGAKVENAKRYCKQCGSEVPVDAAFCSYCGAKIENNSQLNESTSKNESNVSSNSEGTSRIVHIHLSDNSYVDETPKPKKDDIDIIDFSSKSYSSDTDTKNNDSSDKKEYVNPNKVNANPNKKKPFIAIILTALVTILTIVYKFIKDKFLLGWNKFDKEGRIIYLISIAIALLTIFAIGSNKTIPTIVSFIQIALVIVLWLIYKGKIKLSKAWINTVILCVTCVLFIFNIYSHSIVIVKTYNIYTPLSAENCIGKTVDEVTSSFKKAGFWHIEEDVISDLSYEDLDKVGYIESITINDKSDFEGNQKFKNNSAVVIKYHSFKNLTMPFDYQDVKTMDTDTIITTLKNLGFVNIQTEEVLDLDPDTATNEFENEMTINDYHSINKLASYPLDSKIVITTHRAYEKHTLKLHINLPNGLLYSDYDVNVVVNSNKTTLAKGNTTDLEYRLKAGTNAIEFIKDGSSSIKETITLDLTSDIEASYDVKRYSESISLTTTAFYKDETLGENETIIPLSATYCKYKNYKDIQQSFIDVGFTNVSTNILYDIIWGWTEEGEVDSVTLDGESKFIQGNVASKDAEIIITYHMKEEDDPIKMAEEAEREKTSNSVNYSTNSKDTVGNGNTGVYSYKNIDLNLYYIIDFDEGYVYSFYGKDSSELCDKGIIESGDLNTCVTVKYFDGVDTWYNGFHFSFVNQPRVLIWENSDHIETEFYSTNLEDALKIRDTKTMYELY